MRTTVVSAIWASLENLVGSKDGREEEGRSRPLGRDIKRWAGGVGLARWYILLTQSN